METPETKPEAPAEKPAEAKGPTPDAKAEVAAAAAAVATEKLREARKAEQEKAAAKKAEKPEPPKPRRVGPLREVHRTMLKRHRAAQEPLVAELERLAARQRELNEQLGREAREVMEAIAEDLGDKIALHEVSRIVLDDETGAEHLELIRRQVAR